MSHNANIIEEPPNAARKLVFHPNFRETIKEIGTLKARLPPQPSRAEFDFSGLIYPANGDLVTPIDEVKATTLDAANGARYLQGTHIAAYDESIDQYDSLQGKAFLTSHSLIVPAGGDYTCSALITANFYTRAGEIAAQHSKIKFALDPDMESKRDYVIDKLEFLEKNVPAGAVLLHDGPLIGGDVYTYMIRSIKKFAAKDIIPVFFVKNSSSNLVTDNIPSLRGKYNSDMHWAYEYLKPGQRTNMFLYRDRVNPENAKVFCYVKTYDGSPQRVEFHVQTYETYKDTISKLLDMVYYLILAQGNPKNPQVRTIAIAEMYARATINIVDIFAIMRESGMTPTINQDRFGDRNR